MLNWLCFDSLLLVEAAKDSESNGRSDSFGGRASEPSSPESIEMGGRVTGKLTGSFGVTDFPQRYQAKEEEIALKAQTAKQLHREMLAAQAVRPIQRSFSFTFSSVDHHLQLSNLFVVFVSD